MNKKEKCPVCGSRDYRYVHYAEECYGIVEIHEYCNSCGLFTEMAYCEPISGIEFTQTRGRKFNGKYYPKNIRKRKRMRKKYNIKVTTPFNIRYTYQMI